MSKKVNVGITQRIDIVDSRSEIRDAVDQELINMISSIGLFPVPIPNSMIGNGDAYLYAWLEQMQLNAIILSGGNNLNEFPQRDQTEITILSWCEKRDIPVLGLCRGMQLMASYFGIDLVKIEDHVSRTHKVEVLSSKGAWPDEITCYHDYRIKNCPDNFEVAVVAEDKTIEAISGQSLRWEGWMWHPEREKIFREVDLERIRNLFYEQL